MNHSIDLFEMEDGTALVTVKTTNSGSTTTTGLVFDRIGGGWLLDDILDAEGASLHEGMAAAQSGEYSMDSDL